MVLVYRAEWWVCDKNIMLVTRVTRYNAIWQFLRFFGRRIPAAYGFACDQTINAMLWRVTHRAPVRTRRFDAQGRCHCSFASSSLTHIRAWMINARANGKCHPGTRIYRFSYTRVSFDRYMWFILRSDKRCARFRCNVFLVHQDFPFPHRVTGSRRNMTLPLRAFLRTMTPCTLLSS